MQKHIDVAAIQAEVAAKTGVPFDASKFKATPPHKITGVRVKPLGKVLRGSSGQKTVMKQLGQ